MKLTIEFLNGTKYEVPAGRVGKHFAIHRYVERDGSLRSSCWVVTHVPSGYKIPTTRPSRPEAKVLAEKLLAIEGIDWSKERPDLGVADGPLAAIEALL